jgi:hypothetical protein
MNVAAAASERAGIVQMFGAHRSTHRAQNERKFSNRCAGRAAQEARGVFIGWHRTCGLLRRNGSSTF